MMDPPDQRARTRVVDDHFNCQGIVDIHEEGIDRIVSLGLNGGRVDGGDGIKISCVVGIFTVSMCVTFIGL